MMKARLKLGLILLLVGCLVIVGLSTISANDNNTTGDFTELNTLVQNNNVIDLDKDYNATDNSFYTGITITNNVTINGNGHTIDGNYQGRIFDIKTGGTLTLNNVILINGKVSGNGASYGGAIYVNNGATLNINDCTFENNLATGKGNSIYNTGTLIINNSIFDNKDIYNYNGLIRVNEDFYELNDLIQNNAVINLTQNYTAYDNSFYTGITITSNVTINGNGYTIDGNYKGRIFDIKKGGILTLNNVKLINGKVSGNGAFNGGAIYINKNATLNINNCAFENNYAKNYGGAIYNTGTLTVNNSTFTSNKAINNDGGAIHNKDTLTVNNSVFNNNIGNYGGAICSKTSLTVTNSIFTNNQARLDGGTIYAANDLTINNSVFNNNQAKINGGAIFNNNNLIIINSTFNNNTAHDGGVIYSDKKIICKNSYFNNNYATMEGGAINCKIQYLNNCTFYNNNATTGGALWCNDINECNYCIFINNTSWGYDELDPLSGSSKSDGKYSPAVIYVAGSKGINLFKNCIFGNNSEQLIDIHKGDSHVSFIHNIFITEFIINGNFDVIEYNYFSNKNFNKFGGETKRVDLHAYYNLTDYYNHGKSTTAISKITTGNFTELNHLIQNNNVINLDKDYNATDNSFYKGITISNGRNIIINGNGHIIDANYQGRIFDIKTGGSLTLNNVTLINGNAKFKNAQNGGAIYINKGAMLKIINCKFNNNYAKHGKEIYNAGNLEIEGHFNGTIYNQGILNGGVIYCHGETYLDCDFHNYIQNNVFLKNFNDKKNSYNENNIYYNSIDEYKNIIDIIKNDYASINRIDISKIINDSEFKTTLSINSIPNIPLQPANRISCNMTNPFSISTGTPAIPDENNCFEITTITNAGTPYYWVINNEELYGVESTNTYTVDNNPEKLCGGEITNHFVFYITQDKDYFVKLNLIDARTEEIVDTVNSNMVN